MVITKDQIVSMTLAMEMPALDMALANLTMENHFVHVTTDIVEAYVKQKTTIHAKTIHVVQTPLNVKTEMGWHSVLACKV